MTAPVAVAGMACRLPGASGPDEFWRLITDGRSEVGEVPPGRWDVEATYDPQPGLRGKTCSRWGGLLSDVDRFDADLFGITPREVERLDPQQRLVLEVAWEALEDAALIPADLAGSRTGVFIGAGNSDFARMLLQDPSEVDIYSLVGGGLSLLANRLSYTLDLRGPSVVVDTACSGSLVAVHQAMRSLRDGECDLAIAGGVNLCLSPEVDIANSHARLLSPTGGSKVFDESADGFVRSEGCALVVLRRGDEPGPVHAVLKGSAMAGSGRGNGLGAPSAAGQEEVVRLALRNAKVEPGEIGYVETHTTGTAIGDAVEVGSLSRVFGGDRETPLRLGSVKAGIGHLEAASGVVSLIKTILVLRHGWIPPVAVERLSPQIRLGAGVEIPAEPCTWHGPRVAGINSFGYGGNNVHLVVGEASSVPAEPPEGPEVLVLSARSPASLTELVGRYTDFLLEHKEVPLADIAHTARTARTHYEHRLFAVGSTHEELARSLADAEPFVAGKPVIAFEFADDKADGEWFDALCERIPALALIVEDLDGTIDAPGFVPQYALATLLAEWGVCPDLVIGHGSGEVAAACVAGASNPYEFDGEFGEPDTPLHLGGEAPDRDFTIRFCADFTDDGLPRLLGGLHCRGSEVDWAAIGTERSLTHLPSTPFEHHERWPIGVHRRAPAKPAKAHPLLRRR
ncbi:type I polyketide synthase [Amycolatopsis sp. YIM 10]|uniref:type I polyketide synthase n=1 Tax=Amycolatopsis sp. YIM 10 TaxID=2653857 RepID=UPI001290568B|nr:polyketide synthase [Amycolatopsis sp. YIM 10]QFU93021.1 Phthiocerol/phenolphthiocerol synthesis polyketide synthase type I PpsA [Amycolatopsis sp. YIM 10]